MHGGVESPVATRSQPEAAAELASYLAPTHLEWLATEPDVGHRRLDGSLLFADVSGFTRLGERLARRGRIGAEQPTEAINVVLGALGGASRPAGGQPVQVRG